MADVETHKRTGLTALQLLELVPKGISLLVALALTSSMVFQTSFFYSIDRTLLPFFSVQDAVIGALEFLPVAMIALSLGGWVGSIAGNYFGRQRRSLTPHERFIDATLIIIPLAALLPVAIFFPWFVAVLVACLIAVGFSIRHRTLRLVRSDPVAVTVAITGVVVLVASAILGSARAHVELAYTEQNYVLTALDGSTSIAHLIRVGSDAVLIRQDANSVRVIPRTQIKSLVRTGIQPSKPFFVLLKDWWL